MPVEQAALDAVALSRPEYDLLVQQLGREPNEVELGMFGSLWSEHCGYKNSKPLLKLFPSGGDRILTKVGAENAGAIDIGDGLCIVMKVESHNHPSAIEPYQGAATGVGGIVRDIFAMGAYPIALLDSFRFGPPDDPQNRYLFNGVVGGIGGYGNCLGIPTVGGEVVFSPSYNGNPLVNAMCVGFAETSKLLSAKAQGEGNVLLLVGSDTGRDGIHGAMASPAAPTPKRVSRNAPRGPGRQPVHGKAAHGGLLRTRLRAWRLDRRPAGSRRRRTHQFRRRVLRERRRRGHHRPRQGPSPRSRHDSLRSHAQREPGAHAHRREAGTRRGSPRLFHHWELHCEPIGVVTDGRDVVIRDNGVEVGRVPFDMLPSRPSTAATASVPRN